MLHACSCFRLKRQAEKRSNLQKCLIYFICIYKQKHKNQPDRSQQHPLWEARGQHPNAVSAYCLHYYERGRAPLNDITPVFITETYGIPRERPYYQTDQSRAFFNMPFLPRVQGARGRYRLRGDRGVLQPAPGDRRLLGQQ